MSQSGGKSGAAQRRFSESHAICSPPSLGSRQSTFDCFYFFFLSLLPSFYLFRSLSPPATYIKRSCPYTALANVWPGWHKVIGEGFPSFVGVRVARQLRPAHFKNLQKSTAGFSRFPLGPPSFCAVCVHPSSGMAPFFCSFF